MGSRGWTDVARVAFGLIRIVSRDLLWTRVLTYVYARLCFMFSSFCLELSSIASVHSYSLGIASTYSVASLRQCGVALQRSAVRYILDTGLQRTAQPRHRTGRVL